MTLRRVGSLPASISWLSPSTGLSMLCAIDAHRRAAGHGDIVMVYKGLKGIGISAAHEKRFGPSSLEGMCGTAYTRAAIIIDD